MLKKLRGKNPTTQVIGFLFMKKYLKLKNKSFEELGADSYKELWQKAQDEGYDGLMVDVNAVFTKSADEKPKRFHAVLSSAKEDRHGEVVRQNFSLSNFKKNPVVIDSHQYDTIFNILGKMTKVGVKDGSLQGDIEFATMTMAGFMAELMVEQGFVNAVSIGFMPMDFGEKGEITKSELLEVSLVSVPANAEALIEKAFKGIEEEEIKDEEDLEEEEIEDEPRNTKSTLSRVADKYTEQDRILQRVAKELKEAKSSDLNYRKRQIFKELRKLL